MKSFTSLVKTGKSFSGSRDMGWKIERNLKWQSVGVKSRENSSTLSVGSVNLKATLRNLTASNCARFIMSVWPGSFKRVLYFESYSKKKNLQLSIIPKLLTDVEFLSNSTQSSVIEENPILSTFIMMTRRLAGGVP